MDRPCPHAANLSISEFKMFHIQKKSELTKTKSVVLDCVFSSVYRVYTMVDDHDMHIKMAHSIQKCTKSVVFQLNLPFKKKCALVACHHKTTDSLPGKDHRASQFRTL